MRVLHVLPTGPTTGGTETYAVMLAASLPAGLQSTVAMVVDGPVRGDSSIVARFEQAGCDVLLTTPERVAALARRYDLVHIHSWAWWGWMAHLPHPKVFTLHFVRTLPASLDVDHIIHTAAAVQAMQPPGGPPSTHLENAVDLRYFDRARALAAPFDRDLDAFYARAPTLVRVARPIRVDAPLFWDIAERVLRARPVQLVTVHHDDRDERAVEHLPAGLRDRIRLLPGTADVAPFLARASLFLYAATGGTDDLVLKEAMALGVPVVATEASGSYSAAEGGLLVPRWAATGAQACLDLLDDAALRERCVRAGRAAVERRLARLVGAHVELYERLVAQHATAAA